MTALEWDKISERFYETGVDHGVLYSPTNGVYDSGVSWNGLVSVTEAPSGAEASPQYADNIKYLNLVSAEELGLTIEAFTFPEEWGQHDGSASPSAGVYVGQQARRPFGLSYRTRLGNDVDGPDHGYKLHLMYGGLAAPSEKAYTTINDSPEAITFSWEVTTTPVPVAGHKPTALLTIDSNKVSPASLATLEEALYGTSGTDPRLPLPDEVLAMFAGDQTEVTPTEPGFVSATGVITIPTVTGVTYRRGDTNVVVTGSVTIPTAGGVLVIRATPASGSYKFTAGSDDDWSFKRD